MTVTTTSLGAGVTRTTLDQSTKLSAALNTSAPTTNSVASNSNTVAQSVNVDTSALADNSTASFRIDALSIALVGSKLDVIDSGASQVSRLLGQLQGLATLASSTGLSKSQLDLLDGQFQALRLAINNVPPAPPGSTTTPSEVTAGVPVSGNVDANTTLGGFSANNLLPNANLQTPEAAQAATASITTVAGAIENQRAVIASLQQDVEFAAASVDSAAQNQDAAKSTLSPADLTSNGANTLIASLQANPQATVAAQTSRLPDNVLQLLQS